MHLGYGLLTAQHHPADRRTDVEIYRETIELAVEAERVGFASVWTSEHHFVDDGYMPSQLPVLAAIAARTERILLGTGVLLAPMFDPLHLAEDAATVDLISDGRLILGLGLGWRAEEFVGLGGGEGHKGHRLEAIIEILRMAWSDGLVEGDRHGIYTYPPPGVSVTPKPARADTPRIWIGGGAPVAVERAGSIADGYLGSSVDLAHLPERLDLVREGAIAAGRDPDSVAAAVHNLVVVLPDPSTWPHVREHLRYIPWKYGDMSEARGSRVRRLPPPIADDATEDARLHRRAIIGTAEEVADGIRAYADVLGPEGHFIARSYLPGLDPTIQRETLQILGEEVGPLLR